MDKIIENYVRNILEFGCNIKKGDNLVLYSKTECDDLYNMLNQLKDEYGINNIEFFFVDYPKIIDFLETNPSEEEIKNLVKKHPELPNNTKTIRVIDEFHDGHFRRILEDYRPLYCILFYHFKDVNETFFNEVHYGHSIAIDWPNKYWAKELLGSEEELPHLFKLIDSTIPNKNDMKEEIKRLKYIRDFLSKSDISSLHFYTNLGTDLNIELTNNSIWSLGIHKKNDEEFFFNFPSYEVYTSPNCFSAEGRVILSRPNNFYGTETDGAELLFEKGKLTICNSDNSIWSEEILIQDNIDKIGEIALVSNDSPIARTKQVFKSLLLDENAGCHLALGDSIDHCINVDKDLLEKNGYEYYKFNNSDMHQDLVFGNESITVEAKARGNQKILLLDEGKWKI